MTTTPEHDKRIAEMTFSSVYPHIMSQKLRKKLGQLENYIK